MAVTTPDFGIPELAQAQATPEITHNEAIVRLQLSFCGVIDKDLTAPPGAPTEGDAYLINTAAPTGAWAGRGYCLTIYWGGAWRFLPDVTSAGTPIVMGARQEGLRTYVQDEDKTYRWNGAAWSSQTTTASEVGFTPVGTIAATNVQAAIAEAASEAVQIAGHAALSVVARSANSVGDVADVVLAAGQFLGVRGTSLGGFAPTASEVVNVAAGNIAATTVQAALNELDSEKIAIAGHAARSLLGRSANSSGDAADIAGGGSGTFMRDSGTALAFSALVASDFPANTTPLASLTNAAAQFDLIARKTIGAGAWEECTRADLSLARTDAVNTFAAASQTFKRTGNTAAGPAVTVFLDKTVTAPAINDVLGTFEFDGYDTGLTQRAFADFGARSTDVTTGAWSGRWLVRTALAGGFSTRFEVAAGVYTSTATGGDPGLGKFNATGYNANGNIAIDSNALIRLRNYTVATLPSASGITGATAFVTDANTTVILGLGLTVVGGGANKVPVYSDGTNWIIG